VSSFLAGLKTVGSLVAGRVYQDRNTANPTYPYIVLDDYISDVPRLPGDGRALAWERGMQASLFFSGTKPTAEDAGAENKSLVTAIKQAFEGVRIEGDDGKTTAIHVNQTFRRYDPDADEVSYVFDLLFAYLPV
jgi:hypothetical protein